MGDTGNDSMLLKVAVFGMTMSLMCTVLVAVLLPANSGDYDYDEIQGYRDELVSFSGDSMLNQTPWVLTGVYTPWNAELGAKNHIDSDGWLYGESITNYEYIGQSAYIKLDPTQKSSMPLSFDESVASYEQTTSVKWWNSESNVVGSILKLTGLSGAYKRLSGDSGYNTTTVSGDNWNYTGYRYVFDPTLPFSSNSSSVDGALSIVWYVYDSQEGLSGGLDIYGGKVLLASMNATDIISSYNTAVGYATTYDWDFQGTHLTLSIRFDVDAIEAGTPLMYAFSNGDWTMAVSSVSAGNFYDLENSGAFATSVGSVVDTFKDIFTFDLDVGNDWANAILWLLCGLPMCVAMLCVAFRIINTIKFIG